MIFERKILRKILDTKWNKKGYYEIRSNRERNGSFDQPNIMRKITIEEQRNKSYKQIKYDQGDGLGNGGKIALKKT